MRDLNDYYEKYVEEPFEGYMVKYRRRMEIGFLDRYKPRRVLEIGCGMEPMFEHWNEAEEMVVVEPQDSFYQNACQKAKEYSNVEIMHGLFQDVLDELKTRRWDAVLCSGVLGEVSDPGDFLQQIFAISDENTRIMLITSNASSFHRILGKEMGVIDDVHSITGRSKELQQLKVFDKQIMRDLVERSGGCVRDLRTYFIKPFTHGQMRACMEQNIFTEQVLEGMWNMSRYLPEYGAELFCDCGLKTEGETE